MNNTLKVIKNMSFYAICIFFLITLFIYPVEISNATKTGLLLWYNNILPSIFSFSIIVNILSSTNLFFLLSRIFKKMSNFLFKLPPISLSIMFLGMISGYPMGAKVASQFYSQNYLSKDEYFRTLCISNCCGPMFIVSALGLNMFHNLQLGYILLISQILTIFFVGILLRCNKKSSNFQYEITTNYSSKNDFSTIINDSIINSISTVLNICAIVTFFCIITKVCEIYKIDELLYSRIITFLKVDFNIFKCLFYGIIEITNGIYLISLSPLSECQQFLTASFLVNFGGICVLMQTKNVVYEKEDFAFYVIVKLISGLISMFFSYLLYIWLLN